MAKGKFPFALFEKSSKDKEPKGMKEGSKKEEKLDKKQAFKCGGKVKKMALGGATDVSSGNKVSVPVAPGPAAGPRGGVPAKGGMPAKGGAGPFIGSGGPTGIAKRLPPAPVVGPGPQPTSLPGAGQVAGVDGAPIDGGSSAAVAQTARGRFARGGGVESKGKTKGRFI